LIKEACVIFERGCVNAEPLMKQVIVRAPSELKSILLQGAQNGATWNEFIRYAENSGWVAFPEKVVNSINAVNSEKFKKIGPSRTNQKLILRNFAEFMVKRIIPHRNALQ
jgi:hypothetical protein